MSKGPRKSNTSSHRKLRPKLPNQSRAKGWILEQLVRALEAMLATSDYTIKTRHRLKDNVTGAKREADVYIEERLRGNLIRTVIECRHHRRLVDVTYVEQIVTKRTDLGSPNFCIVAMAGFTKGALAKAAHYGIKTFTLDDVNSPSFMEWLVGIECVELRPQFELNSWKLYSDIQLEFTPTEELIRAELETLAFLDCDGTPTISVKGALDAALPHIKEEAIEKLNRDGNHSIPMIVLFQKPMFIRAVEGLIPIKGIEALISISWQKFPFKLTYSEYRQANSDPIRAKVAHATISSGITVVFTGDNTGKRLLTIIPPEGGTFSGQMTLVGEGQIVEPPATKLDAPKAD